MKSFETKHLKDSFAPATLTKLAIENSDSPWQESTNMNSLLYMKEPLRERYLLSTFIGGRALTINLSATRSKSIQNLQFQSFSMKTQSQTDVEKQLEQ